MTKRKIPKTAFEHGSGVLNRYAMDAFWREIHDAYPAVETDYRDNELGNALWLAAQAVIDKWIFDNVPRNCKTCGSEIVKDINGSNFNEGDCGPCEYERYRSSGAK